MTHTIDHRILIPTGPEVIWQTISDLTQNPRWQVDCREVSFLTSLQQGQGTRWRYANERGREFVAEITAWYNTLGYEYHIVDGAPFKHNQGRLRLQEIAEGTIVQWTFNYELRGMLSGIRTIGSPRNVENAMIDSLWTLWKHITETKDADMHEARSLMRDAPDVEQRANYVARHQGGYSPVIAPSQPTETPDTQQPFTIKEPPVSDDDTRPRPVIVPQSPVSQPETTPSPDPIGIGEFAAGSIAPNVAEPDFLREIHIDELDADTNPGLTAQPVAPLPPAPEKPVEPERAIENSPPATTPPDVPPIIPEPVQASPVPTAEQKPATPEPASSNWTLERLPDEAEAVPAPSLREEDTSSISVFDLFGVPKPSETQETQAVAAPIEPDIPAAPAPIAPPPVDDAINEETAIPDTQNPPVEAIQAAAMTPISDAPAAITIRTRTGLRLRLRHDRIRLRRP